MALDLTALLGRARDPSTPGPELERISLALSAPPGAASDPRGRAVLEALAVNPNAPPALLFWLADRVPGKVASNPALALLPLENPALLLTAPATGLCALLRRAELPTDWLEQAARHPNSHVRVAVAAAHRTPPSALALLAGDADAYVRRSAAFNPLTPPPVLDRLADDAQWAVRTAVAGNPSAPPSALARVARTAADAKHDYEREPCRHALAANPATPLDTLDALAEKPKLLVVVAGNPSLPALLVESFAAHPSAEVRAAVARRPDLPSWLRRRLAADGSAAVRAAVARHADDPALLVRLSLDREGQVRRALIDNPRTPNSVLERLAQAPVAHHRAAARALLASRAKARAAS